MEITEIYSITISPPIVSKFAVQWSKDNHISLLTERGIHVFELIPSPLSPHSVIKFSRSFIYAPSIFPAETVTSKMNSKIWYMKREELYSFLMDESLTPKVCNVKQMVPKIVNITWSPQNMIYPSKCVLAILNSAGAITIAYKITKDWYPVYDLCSIRYSTVEKEINAKLKNSKSASAVSLTIRNCIKTLQASSMTWSKLFTDFAYFAVAYGNGDIVIYKLPRISSYNKVSEPTIVGTVQLNESVKITALHWITIDTKEYIIIVTYFDGRIHGIKIKDHGQNLEIKPVEKYYDYTDRIAVTAIRVFPETDSGIKVLLSKGSFLFLIHFTIKGILKDVQHVQLEGFSISGMICIDPNRAVVTTEDSCMFAVDTGGNNFSAIKITNALPQAHVRYLGLAHSLNYVLLVNLSSPSIVYDHLVQKEPSKMCIFSLKGDDWDPLLILKNNKWKKIEQLWDCLEVVRMKATKAAKPATVLPKVPSNLESLPLHELQIAMWISVMAEICEKKKVIHGIGSIAGEISEAQPLIFVHTACNYLECLQSKSSLLEEERLSITLLTMYLEVYLAGEENEEMFPLCKRIKEILKKTSKLRSKNVESCNLCGEVINDLSWKITKCPQGHILPRCAITLLQITTMQYKKCPICDLLFHSCLDQEYGETKCLFCDVPAIEENRALGSNSYVSVEKSLSRPQNCTSEIQADGETEATAEES